MSGEGRRGRTSRSALSLVGTEGECAGAEVGSPSLLQALPRGNGEGLGIQVNLSLLPKALVFLERAESVTLPGGG